MRVPFECYAKDYSIFGSILGVSLFKETTTWFWGYQLLVFGCSRYGDLSFGLAIWEVLRAWVFHGGTSRAKNLSSTDFRDDIGKKPNQNTHDSRKG